MNTLHIKTGDTVIVLSGKDRGKKGKVLAVQPKKGTATVENIAQVTRHVKPRRQGQPGGLMTQEAPIRASKLIRVCPKCGETTRLAHIIQQDGSRERQCKKCREII